MVTGNIQSASPPHSQQPCFLDYEHLRNARLAANRKRMEALGLVDLSRSLGNSARRSQKSSTTSKNSKGRDLFAVASAPARRSSRLMGTALPSYKEVSAVHEVGASSVATDSRQCQPEFYTKEDEKLLGDCDQDWELFKDGYAADGTRIYDPINGKTCHQCRQKTLGLRTWCNQCKSLRGQFCGDCLFMRYGENILETTKNTTWVCPGCRGICNCSCCRIKKGWAPTGSMYRLALRTNFKSVAHYLIMTRRIPMGTSGSTGKDFENFQHMGTPKGSIEDEGSIVPMGISTTTGEQFEDSESIDFARRSLTFSSYSSNEVAAERLKKEHVIDVSDVSNTEYGHNQERANSSGDRLHKRPRRCKKGRD